MIIAPFSIVSYIRYDRTKKKESDNFIYEN